MRESSPGASLAVLSVCDGVAAPNWTVRSSLVGCLHRISLLGWIAGGAAAASANVDRHRWNKTETTSARDGVEEPSREPKITSRKKLYLRTTGATGTVAAGRSHPDKDRLRRLAMVVRCDLV